MEECLREPKAEQLPCSEEALRRDRDFMAAVLDTVGALVVVLDREGRVIRFNRTCEEITGYRAEEMLGEPFWEKLLLPEEAEAVKGVFKELTAGHFPNKHQNYWVAKNGERHLITWSNTALVDRGGKVQYVIGTGLDLTEERRLAEGARRAEHLASLATVAAAIAHEIKNPLNAAHLQLELLRRRLTRRKEPDLPAAMEASRGVSEEIQRISRLLAEFLEFARPRPLQPTRVDLGELAESVISFCGPETEKAGVTVTFEAKGDLRAQVDSERIRQALLNLLRNAVQATGSGGRTHVMLARKGDSVILSIADDGPGLPREQDRIFEPFFSTKEKGAGLGLAITQRIVSDHQGTIRFESRPGRTVFEVALPRSLRWRTSRSSAN